VAEITDKYAGDMSLETSETLSDEDYFVLFDTREGKRLSVGDAIVFFKENILSQETMDLWEQILGL